MYKGKGPHAMNLDILSDEEVRAHACIIVHVTTPLHCQYQSELKAQTNGLASLIQWAAARANGEWVHVVYSILGVQSSSELYAAMRCAPHCDPPAAFDWGYHSGWHHFDPAGDIICYWIGCQLCLGTNAVHIHASSGQRCPSISPACGTKNCNAQTPVLSSEHFDCWEAVRQETRPEPDTWRLSLPTGALCAGTHVLTEKGKIWYRFRWEQYGEKTDDAFFRVIIEHQGNLRVHLCSFVWRGFPVKQEQSVCTTFALDVHNGVLLRKSVGDDAALSKKFHMGKFIWGRTAWMNHRWCRISRKHFNLGKSFPLPSGENVTLPKSANGVHKTQWRHAGPLSHYKSSAAACYMMHDSPAGFPNAAHTLGRRESWNKFILHRGVA